MRVLGRIREFFGAVPRASVRREARRFLAATADCRQTQWQTLRRLLALNADSRFSRRHGLDSVRTAGDFRRRLPIGDFEQFRPHIERIKQGDAAALLGSRNPLLMFSLSSGTTAESKFIPITRPFLDDYRRGWQIWGIGALDDHPGINSRHIVQLSGDHDRSRTEGGTPCGNISGLVSAMQKRIVRTMYTLPASVGKLADHDARLYVTLRLALADPDAGMIITANPSTLIHLAERADRDRERLIRDIHDGTLSHLLSRDAESSERSAPLRVAANLRLRPDPRRARELERLVERTGRLRPSGYWPGLQLVAVWTGGSCAAYLPTLRTWFGNVPVRDHGLSASEGRMTI
ncbi:MAG: GH3 family domain-containing protein, partial [Planctomycetaceae bacterium]